jgi:two-component system nitrogen regulation response regulator GlnG
VREFQSVIKQALLQATGPVLLPEFLPAAIRRPAEGEVTSPASEVALSALSTFVKQQLAADSTSLYADFTALTDCHLLTLVLQHTAGNLSRAARFLGITRATLRVKLEALGLSADRFQPANEET